METDLDKVNVPSVKYPLSGVEWIKVNCIDDLKPGDHISYKMWKWFHAIVIGVNRKKNKITVVRWIMLREIVELDQHIDSLVKSKLQKSIYHNGCYDDKDVVFRAKARVHETEFSLVKNFARAFPEWCKTGRGSLAHDDAEADKRFLVAVRNKGLLQEMKTYGNSSSENSDSDDEFHEIEDKGDTDPKESNPSNDRLNSDDGHSTANYEPPRHQTSYEQRLRKRDDLSEAEINEMVTAYRKEQAMTVKHRKSERSKHEDKLKAKLATNKKKQEELLIKEYEAFLRNEKHLAETEIADFVCEYRRNQFTVKKARADSNNKEYTDLDKSIENMNINKNDNQHGSDITQDEGNTEPVNTDLTTS